MNTIEVTLSASGSQKVVSVDAGALLPDVLAEHLRLTDINFAASSIQLNDRQIATNQQAQRTALNDGDEIYVGKTHTNG